MQKNKHKCSLTTDCFLNNSIFRFIVMVAEAVSTNDLTTAIKLCINRMCEVFCTQKCSITLPKDYIKHNHRNTENVQHLNVIHTSDLSLAAAIFLPAYLSDYVFFAWFWKFMFSRKQNAIVSLHLPLS